MLVSWEILKDFSLTRKSSIQWIDLGYSYHTKCFDSAFVVECDLNKGTDDCIDFEANFKDTSNQKLDYKTDVDGAQIINPKFATSGRVYQSMFCSLETSKHNSLVSKDVDNGSNDQFVFKIYDVNGSEIMSGANESAAVLTTLEWRPTVGYDIQGFCIYQQTQPASDIYLNAIMAHNVPAAYGGSKVVIRGCNLKYGNYGNREMDWVGDSASVVDLDNTYYSHWNIVKIYHNAGVQHPIMVEVVWYV